MRKRRWETCYQFVFLCSQRVQAVCARARARARAHTHTHTHQPGEGGRAGLKAGGQSQGGENQRDGKRQVRTLSLSLPAAPFLRTLGSSWAGGEGAQLGHIWQAPSLTEGRKGAAGAASMLYCFPPWDALPPRATQVVFWRGAKSQKGGWQGSLSAQVTTTDPNPFAHLPLPLSSSLTYPPESSRKSSVG